MLGSVRCRCGAPPVRGAGVVLTVDIDVDQEGTMRTKGAALYRDYERAADPAKVELIRGLKARHD